MTTPRRPPGRYDEPRALPSPVRYAGAAVLAVALLLLTLLFYDRYAGGRVQFGTQGYRVVDDGRVEVRYEVRKPVDRSVVCALQARDRDNTVVGTGTVTVGPSDRETVVGTRTVETTARATTAEVVGCKESP